MKISTKGTYALEITVDLAMHSEGGRLVSLREIAERRRLSEKYLERIIKRLKKAGIAGSVRGAYGGYFLAREPSDICVRDVLCAAEGELAPVACLTRRTECGMDCDTCATRSVWLAMLNGLLEVTGEVTIQDLAEEAGRQAGRKKIASGKGTEDVEEAL